MLIQHNIEISDYVIAIFLDHTDQFVYSGVKLLVFIGTVLINILYLDRVSQFIIGKNIAAAIPDAAPGTGYIPGLLRLQYEVVQVFLSMDDLQHKTAVYQHSPQQSKDNGQKRQPACKK